MQWIAPIPACTSWSSPAQPGRRPTLLRPRTDLARSGDATTSLLEDERDELVIRALDADRHRTVLCKGVALQGHSAGLRGGHLQDVVIPLGLGLEVLAGVNRGAAPAVRGAIAIKDGLGSAFIHEAAGDHDDAVVIANGHGPGLNHGLPGKFAFRGQDRKSTRL